VMLVVGDQDLGMGGGDGGTEFTSLMILFLDTAIRAWKMKDMNAWRAVFC
jgi:hypothetical protein